MRMRDLVKLRFTPSRAARVRLRFTRPRFLQLRYAGASRAVLTKCDRFVHILQGQARLALGGILCALVVGAGLGALRAQPAERVNGRTALGLVLRQINNTGTFMMATAHPDDEHNGVLARLSKGEGIRTTLVTATRGDGGQNEIGSELFDALAVLRTEELLAAHRLDGAEQYFTRAVDFGYSFSRDETFEKWGREEILGDFVRMIRTIRPDVIAGLSRMGTAAGSIIRRRRCWCTRPMRPPPTRAGFRSRWPKGSGPGKQASSTSVPGSSLAVAAVVAVVAGAAAVARLAAVRLRAGRG